MASPRGPRVTSINDAMRDMAENGDDGFGASQLPDFPIAQELPASMLKEPVYTPTSGQLSDTYFLVTYNKESEIVRVETLNEELVIERLEELGGVSRALSTLPTMNPVHWDGRFAIIRGSLVVPTEVKTIKLL